MTKNEALRRARLDAYLLTLGFTESEVASLRRINSTLQRWYELECGSEHGAIERDEATGKPYWINYTRRYLGANDARMRSPVADREAGALRRLSKIIKDCNARKFDALPNGGSMKTLGFYVQTDPRGAALYILRPGDISIGDKVESCYTRGVCVF